MAEPHEVLDVPPDADERTVRTAYRDLLKEHHPDHGGSRDAFLRITEAYETLLERDDPCYEAGPTTVCRDEIRVARPVQRDDEVGLLARGDGLEVHLLAVTDRVPTDELLPEHVEHGRRFVACFVVSSCADDAVTWEGRRVRFVDSTGERHLPSVYRPRREDLPGPWRGDDLEIDPGESVRSLLVSRSVPAEVEIEHLVYDGSPSIGTERGLRFDLDDDRRHVLDRDPFE